MAVTEGRRGRSAPAQVIHWLRTRPLGRKLTRYSIGSVVALVTSEVVFAWSYGAGWLDTTGASIAAFVAGAVPNWVLNRVWAWGRRGRVRPGREILLYAAVSLASLAALVGATGLAGHFVRHATASHAERTAAVAAVYLAACAILFGLKFWVFDAVVFAEPRRGPTSGQ
jgi:putative flippase GtrA